MAAVITSHRNTTGLGRTHLRLVGSNETAEPLEAAEPLFSPQAVLAAIVLTLVLMVGAVAIGRGAFAGFAPDAPSAASVATAGTESGRTVMVRPGDTMWSIARDLQPTGDIRPLVDQLVTAHGSTAIAPGDRITVAG
ncbi:MAG: LysM domain-containing protein [Aquihabitans sp.]